MCFWWSYIFFCNSSISGLQEECPLLNESTTNLLTKLQHENQLLQYKLEKLMTEKDAAACSVKQNQNRECGTETKFRNEAILPLHPSLQAGIHERPLNLEISGYHVTFTGSQQHTSDSRNQYGDEVRNVAKQSPVVSVGRFLIDENAEYITPVKYKEETAIKQPSREKKKSVTFEPSSEYSMLTNPKNSLNVVNLQSLEKNSVSDVTGHVDDVMLEQFVAHNNFAKFSVELNGEGNVKESLDLVNKNKAVADFCVVTKDEKNSESLAVKDDGVAQASGQVTDKVFVHPVKDEDVLEHTVTTHSSGGDTNAEVNRNVDSLQPEVTAETYDWKENNIEIIKSTLKLLQARFDDIAPTDTGRILSSSIALATEVEQSLVHLQDTIAECEVEKTAFCAQFQKRVEVSVSKLKETAEGLVDDIDEHLYKLVSTVVRKLKKFKGKLQDRWCHLTDKYHYESDAVYNWLHSSVLLDCKESDKQTGRKFNQFSAKKLHKLNDKSVRSASDENHKGTYVPDVLKSHNSDEECDDKSVNSNTLLEVDQKNNVPVQNHDSLNDQNLKINTPVTVHEESGKSSGQEQYMSESQKNFKHDNGGTFKREFNGKEKSRHESKQKIVPPAKTCWQTQNGETVCHKCKTNQQHLHSENFKGQDCEDDAWCEKKMQKNKFNDKTKEHKKHETEHSLLSENKHNRQSVILEQHTSWILDNADTPKQNNVSGDWVLKMANNRAEQRKLERRSDWVFDRADARKLKREKHLNDNWYFERARGREDCRYYPRADWCKTGKHTGPKNDRVHQRDNENEYHEDGRLRHGPRWTNKFVPRPFAATGKLIKDSFTYFQNKINYHSHR
jgi:hypothetical protein